MANILSHSRNNVDMPNTFIYDFFFFLWGPLGLNGFQHAVFQKIASPILVKKKSCLLFYKVLSPCFLLPLPLLPLPLSPSIISSYSHFLRRNPAHNPSMPQTHEQPLLWLPVYWDNRYVPLCLVFFSLLSSWSSFLGFWNIYMKESKCKCIHSKLRGIVNKTFCS